MCLDLWYFHKLCLHVLAMAMVIAMVIDSSVNLY